MIKIHKNNERGKTITDWLTSYHSFSFDQYYDPAHTNFGPLVVLNDDVIKPGTGFGSHSHENMEILTYVLEGALEHKDSTGKGEVLKAGDIGRMSAGTGIIHSEYNHSRSEPVRLLQIWLLPKHQGTSPSHEHKSFITDQRRNVLLPVASDDTGVNGALINAYATMYISRLEKHKKLQYDFLPGYGGYLFVADGIITLNNNVFAKGDAALISHEMHINLDAREDAEIIFFDVIL